MRPSTVHNSQHVWLMFDTESQLFLTHGHGCGLDSNDGGSLESGPGSRLDDCGYRQEALLQFLECCVKQCDFDFCCEGLTVKWSLKALLRSGSKIAFNSVSMPTEAISRHDFLQMLHSWCESKKSIKPNHFQQRSTSAADRQADRQHSCERSNPTEIVI